jgi:hypothetical protein
MDESMLIRLFELQPGADPPLCECKPKWLGLDRARIDALLDSVSSIEAFF